MLCICFSWSSEISLPIALLMDAIACGSMFFIISIPAFIMSGFMFSIISIPFSSGISDMSGIAASLPLPGEAALADFGMPGMPIPCMDCAILAIAFICSGSMFFIIPEIILSCSALTFPSCGAIELSADGSMFSSISACCLICSGVNWSSMDCICAGSVGGAPGNAGVIGVGVGGDLNLVGSTPSAFSTSARLARTVLSDCISAAFFRSERASASFPSFCSATPRRKYAFLLSPFRSTVAHSVTASSYAPSLSLQLARFKWHASLSSATAFLSAPPSPLTPARRAAPCS
mmetsp:Transcript_31470/g.65899  ORF Transcript_31470/g.65899 Transcript_31470/m.65899 type:complete len:289 (-) Transcript_31470:584-1450(-)